MVPDALRGLAAPPRTFVACKIPNHLGPNFKNHTDFSSKRNKLYWILFDGPNQGVYSLKASCLAAMGRKSEPDDVVGFVQTWEEVLAIWAVHCYHRHGKCATHPHLCVTECTAIKRESPVKREVKQEDSGLSVKRESTSPSRRRPRGEGSRKPPSYTPVPETEEESDTDETPLPLYVDDTPSPPPLPATPPRTRSVSYHPAPAVIVKPNRRTSRTSVSQESKAPTPASSPEPSEASSLSMSSVSTAAPPPQAKGKGRAEGSGNHSAAHASTSAAQASKVSLDDPFYVGANGSIHHSSAQAFSDVGAGRVQVVMGWEAATRYARRLVASSSSSVSQGGGGDMEVDD
ncbi:hypothetical protein DFH06DRAFT_1336856 [Mycena polygramma]|nr:hypothetical protein DFH06DRAFT_1336856 [Mycena polygramma]